ncbi:hypothetical protein [Sphaerisporangium rubeum]|uniref:Uncharacterized protein n=1 Tax=Sphaerisporangium rubeum TaxID=321317 RepID=A0A7X0IE79_9ACTN|nr:hypothetical protein [Sphaerisporangium rubeum]MBB6472047.1 hypothetical protein [Sphaerisporangium rubeum]
MTWLVLAFIIAAAILAPLFGADTRDGRNWQPVPSGRNRDQLMRNSR